MKWIIIYVKNVEAIWNFLKVHMYVQIVAILKNIDLSIMLWTEIGKCLFSVKNKLLNK